jgi:hypothetical protein
MVSHGCSSHVAQEGVLLVIAAAHKVPHRGVAVVANCSKNHEIPFLHGAESDVLHCLNEGQSATVRLPRLFLEVGVKGGLEVDIVTGPELHAADPRDQVLGEAAPNEGRVLEHSRALLLIEVSVLEHGAVRLEVPNTCGLLLGTLFDVNRSCSQPTQNRNLVISAPNRGAELTIKRVTFYLNNNYNKCRSKISSGLDS